MRLQLGAAHTRPVQPSFVAVTGTKCGYRAYIKPVVVARVESEMRKYILPLVGLLLIAGVIGFGVASQPITALACFGPNC